MKPIIGVEHLDDLVANGVVLCHVGTTMARADPEEAYLAGHLPGARFLSLDDSLAGPAAAVAGRHPLPSPADFATSLAAIGVTNDASVVAYDDRGGAFASRLVWMLRIIGHDAALLDGGLPAWTARHHGDGLERGSVDIDAVERRAIEWPPDSIADGDSVAGHLAGGGVVIDSREAPRYRGEVEPIDAVAGHVPGAINIPFADNLTDGHFRSTAELAARFAAAADDADAIVYCGSGVTACHNALAMEASGLPLPRVYVGSWSGWSTEPGRPVATS